MIVEVGLDINEKIKVVDVCVFCLGVSSAARQVKELGVISSEEGKGNY